MEDPPASFGDLARFLTGAVDLDAQMLDRAWTGLLLADADFGKRATELRSAVVNGRFSNVDAFAASFIATDGQILATASTIISAFYMGTIGHGASSSLVGYEDALMYRPTLDTTSIPTYAAGGAGWWASKPVTTVADVIGSANE